MELLIPQEIQVTETIIILIYFIGVTALGFYTKGKIKDDISYYLADRSLGVFFAGAGRFATVSSSFSFMGVLGLGYALGVPFMLSIAVGLNIGYLMTQLLLSEIRNSDTVSVADFLSKRYKNNSNSIRVVTSILALLIMFPTVVAQIVGAGIVGELVVGMNPYLAMIVLTVVFALYVFLGGLWAVSWTDMFQGILLVIFMVVPVVAILNIFGGNIPALTASAIEVSPHFLTGVLPMTSHLGAVFVFIGSMMSFPAFVFWSLASTTVSVQRRSIIVTTLMGFITYSAYFFLLAGALYVVPDLARFDMAYFPSMRIFFADYPFVVGLAASAPLAAMMSSTDGPLLACSTIVSNDLWARIKPGDSKQKLLAVGRVATLVFAAASLAFALTDPGMIGDLIAAAAGSAGSSFAFPLVLGVWWRRMNGNGALVGMIVGYVTFMSLTLLANLPPQTPILFSLPANGIACVVVSLLTSKPSAEEQKFVDVLHNIDVTDS